MTESTSTAPVRFAIVGADHNHIFGQAQGLIEAGCECVAMSTNDPESGVYKVLRSMLPNVPVVEEADILADDSIDLVVTAAIPNQRGPIAVRALRAGKNVVADKPGCTTLEQLDEIRAAVEESGRFWSVTFSERFEVPAVAKAGELARSGRIGRVVQTLGLGPHREKAHAPGGRPDWFYDEEQYGGILTDIASHQVDQFLWFTGASTGEVAYSMVANYEHPDQLGLNDFGEMNLVTEGASAYIRCDWFTPPGLPAWGDGRLIILGTEGYIELRKYVDVEGRPGGNHLFVVDQQGTEYINCEGEQGTYYRDLVADVREGSRTAAPQEHTYEVMRLAITAQRDAVRRGNLESGAAQ